MVMGSAAAKAQLFQFGVVKATRHTDGGTEADITIQTCRDADRLDLGRVGMMPEPAKLCTPAARTVEMIRWADGRVAFDVIPELVKDEWGIEEASGNQ